LFQCLPVPQPPGSIFKEMLINAPGTYNHSIMVANMAEAASKEIQANSLLARVGGYYHDIGKLRNSTIFIENKQNNKIDMTAREYSKEIISHVEKGKEIAKKMNLPQTIIDFIEQHHGDSTMTFFYHQALEEAHKNDSKEKISQEDFRYPGPKPKSKETAILMLADAIEAASRSIQDASYHKLEQMVKKIFSNKLNNGELDYSNLTLMELNKIQNAFLKILNGVFHTRIEYPDDEEIKNLEKKVHGK
jgi:putative nucleotidyltransferase with HDIG domain